MVLLRNSGQYTVDYVDENMSYLPISSPSNVLVIAPNRLATQLAPLIAKPASEKV
jgi:hypothetical protein